MPRINADVTDQLLTRILDQEPVFLEQAVLDLLIAMGYGGAEGSATRTQLSNDGGIDGIADQDALGLSRIYVQGKRYAADNIVGGYAPTTSSAAGDPGVRRSTGRQPGQSGRLHHDQQVQHRCSGLRRSGPDPDRADRR